LFELTIMVNCLVVSLVDCLFKDGFESGTFLFEPGVILSKLPTKFKDDLDSLIIWLSDSTHTVEYSAPVFLSKSYYCKNGIIRFGAIRLNAYSLTMKVGIKIIIDSDSLLPVEALD
jgi:hypothetical protein